MSLVLIRTRNVPIPTIKIRQIEYQTVFLNSTLWKMRGSLNPKAQAVNKAQRQLKPVPYFPIFFKSRLRAIYSSSLYQTILDITSPFALQSWLSLLDILFLPIMSAILSRRFKKFKKIRLGSKLLLSLIYGSGFRI